jgi:uncharacterized protein (TIGR02246 family)
MLRPIAVLTLALLLLAACGSPRAFGPSDRSQIEASAETWRLAALRGDAQGMAAMYARDAVLLPPNAQPVRGRVGIEDWFADEPRFEDLRTVRLEVEGDGDLAYVWGTWSRVLMVGEGSSVPDRGKYLEIWRRREDGVWRIERAMYNSDLPARVQP